MKFKVISFATIVLFLVILYVFVGCGRTDLNVNQGLTEEVQSRYGGGN